MEGWRLGYRHGVLLGAILMAVVANIVDFPRVERDLSSTYEALHRHPGAELRELVVHHSGATVRDRFGPYAELRHWAQGADMWLAPDTRLRRQFLVGLSGLDEISSRALSPPSAAELARIRDSIVTEGEERDIGRFAVALDGDSVELLVTYRDEEEVLLIIDARLLDASLP